MSIKWQRLSLSNPRPLPPILFKYAPTPSGYELYLTDLTSVWVERLNRKDILRRAEEDNTTIDPSEDLEQFKVLLQKIGGALNHERGTSTMLHARPQVDALELLVSSQLPAPLEPLKWKLYLLKESQSSATNQLLLPLLRAEADRVSHEQNLIELLHRKDWVLGKLFDKIETMGIDLSTIFPGISGLRTCRKGPTLSQAAQHINGLAPFDETAWRDEIKKTSPNSNLATNMVAEVLQNYSDLHQYDVINPAPDNWWSSLTVNNDIVFSPTREDNQKTAKVKPSKDPMETETDAGTETEDDEFERQQTPPRLKKSELSMEGPPLQSSDKHTESEKEAKEKDVLRTNSPKALTGKPKGLGMIGGKKQPKISKHSPPPPNSPKKKHLENALPHHTVAGGDETDSVTSEEQSNPAPKVVGRENGPVKPSSKPSRGLGVIGGKKKVTQVFHAQPPPFQTSEPQIDSSGPELASQKPQPDVKKSKPAAKLGVIGGKGAGRTIEPSPTLVENSPGLLKEEDQDSAGQDLTKNSMLNPSPTVEERKPRTPPTNTKQETEQEKADRKREELKRQLEAKSKAPLKKKRKF